LLQKDVAFDFGERCKDAFDTLKKALTTTPIIQPPDWTLPFELMCDASNFAVGAVLAQRDGKLPHVIYYALPKHWTQRMLTTPQLRRNYWLLCLPWTNSDRIYWVPR